MSTETGRTERKPPTSPHITHYNKDEEHNRLRALLADRDAEIRKLKAERSKLSIHLCHAPIAEPEYEQWNRDNGDWLDRLDAADPTLLADEDAEIARLREGLADTLREHYPDFEYGVLCKCGELNDTVPDDMDAAVEAWIAHVLLSPSPQGASE